VIGGDNTAGKGQIRHLQHSRGMLADGLFPPKVTKENKGVMGENKPTNTISPLCILQANRSFLAV
jgi:hypothetical protein